MERDGFDRGTKQCDCCDREHHTTFADLKEMMEQTDDDPPSLWDDDTPFDHPVP